MQPQITAIILAAGYGTRLGQPKWQLPLAQGNFLTTIIDKLQQTDINNIVCVANQLAIPNNTRVLLAINFNPNLGMISSIYCGIQAFPDSNGYLIIPVDHPYVHTATFKLLLQTFSQHSSKIIRPSYKNTPGHPIIIPDSIAKKIPNSDYPGGLRKFLRINAAPIYNLPINDKNILRNINTSEDLING